MCVCVHTSLQSLRWYQIAALSVSALNRVSQHWGCTQAELSGLRRQQFLEEGLGHFHPPRGLAPGRTVSTPGPGLQVRRG